MADAATVTAGDRIAHAAGCDDFAPVRRFSRANMALIAGCAAIYSVGNILPAVIPQVVEGTIVRFHLSDGQAGFIPTLEALLNGLVMVLLTRLRMTIRPRTAALVSTALFIAASILSVFAGTYSGLLMTRVVAGFAGGIILFIPSIVASRAASPDQAYADMNVVNQFYTFIYLLLLPSFTPAGPGLGVFGYVAAVCLPLVPFLLMLPRCIVVDDTKVTRTLHGPESPTPSGTAPLIAGLVVIVTLMSLQSFANYTFAVILGKEVGLNGDQVATIQAIAFAVSVIGAWASKIGNSRFGRLRPLVACLLLAMASNYLTARPPSATVFEICVVVNMVTSYFILPYLCSYATAIDGSGKGAAVITGVFVISCALASAAAGFAIDMFGLPVLGVSTIVIYIVCIVIAFWISGTAGTRLQQSER